MNNIKNNIYPKKKIKYDDIKKIVEDEANYKNENKYLENNIINKSKNIN